MGTVLDLVRDLRYFKTGLAHASPRWRETGVAQVIVCGPSGSGKTTIVNMVRNSSLNRKGAIGIPQRFITRPLRQNDDLDENMHLRAEQFDARSSSMSFTWTRRFSAKRVERYGFAALEDALVVLYSGNNALFEERQHEAARRAIGEAFILGVRAKPDVRYLRFKARNPALLQNAEEMQHRFGGREVPIVTWAHAVIDTDAASLSELESEVVTFFTRLLSGRRRALGL